MYLNQVEAFVSVVKYKSFSKAAKNLYLSQPTVSAYVKALENEIGTQLIFRTTKDVTLSEAGEIFYKYAEELIRIRDVAFLEMQKYSNTIAGNLSISASSFPAQYVLPKIIHEIQKTESDISFSLKQLDGLSVINSVENFNCELGITDFIVDDSKCNFEPFLNDKLVLCTPNTEEYRALNGSYPLERLTTDPIIWRDEGAATNVDVTNFLQTIDLSPDDLNIVIQMPSVESAKQSVLNQIGISFISSRAVSKLKLVGGLLTFDLNSDLLTRTLYLVTNKNRVLSPVAKHFCDFTKNLYKDYPDC